MKKSFISAVICFMILGIFISIVVNLRLRYFQLVQMQVTQRSADHLKFSMEQCIKKMATDTKILAFTVEEFGPNINFESLAENLLDNDKGITALELLKDGVITNVFPIGKNKTAIGYNIFKDTLRNKEALLAKEKKEFTVAGPLTLKQGGSGIVGRLPIFIKGKFYGFSAVIVDFDSLLKSAFVNEGADELMSYQLQTNNLYKGGKNYYLNKDPLFENEFTVKTHINMTDWIALVKPKNPITIWTLSYTIAIGILFTIVFSLFIGYLIYIPGRLETLVNLRTNELVEKEKNLGASLDKINTQNDKLKDLLWVNSHKIRAPLARILGSVHLIKSEQVPDNLLKIVRVIEQSALEFDQIIKDVSSNNKEGDLEQ